MKHRLTHPAANAASTPDPVPMGASEPQLSSGSLHAIVTQSADALLIVDAQGLVRFVNPAVEVIFGRTGAELLGTPLGLPLTAGDETDIEIIRPSGSVAIVEIHVEPINWQDEPVYLVSLHDVTARKRNEQLLIEAQQFLRSTLDALSAQIAILDLSGTILAVNAAWQERSRNAGYDPYRSGVGYNYLTICDATSGPDAELAHRVAGLIRSVIDQREDAAYLEYPCRFDNSVLWFAMRITRFGEGANGRVVIAHEEITERKVAEQIDAGRRRVLEAIARHHGLNAVCSELLQMVQRQYPDAVYVGLDLRTQQFSAAAAHLAERDSAAFGQAISRYAAPEPGEPPLTQIIPAHDPEWQALRPLIERTGIQRIWLAHILTSTGGTLGALTIGRRNAARISPTDLAVVELIVQLCAIAIEQHDRTVQLAYQAHHDTLTGLPNRQLFEDRLNLALEGARRGNYQVAVLFIDLDRFKQINDTLGHAVGDALLVQLARRFEGALRATDTLARHGGDEFMIVLAEIHHTQQVVQVAQRLHQLLHLPFLIEGHELYVTASIGASMYPTDGADIGSLQRNADAAMYRAKATLRNSFHLFDPSANQAAFERLRVEGLLRRAIEREELHVYYQPKFDRSGRINGAEALLRWQSPDLGMVPPNQFIPIAEDIGMIVEIGEWCLREVCRQSLEWRQAGLPLLKVAVNVSAIQFAQANFITNIAHILAERAFDPALLELELTETMLMGDHDAVQRQLTLLSNLRLSLAIDDFGTGYSSLGYLHRLPISVLKIDRSFVAPLGTAQEENHSRAILSAIVTLAHHLQMQVIAEGVETAEQYLLLTELGCDLFQGYYFSRPLPAAEMTTLLVNAADAP